MEGVWWVEVHKRESRSVTNGIKSTAIQLLQVARELRVQMANTSAEVHTAGLVVNSRGSDRTINFYVEARGLEPMVGKGSM